MSESTLLLIYQHIALRWSAKPWLTSKSINIWLLWSQIIVWLRLRQNQIHDAVSPDIPTLSAHGINFALIDRDWVRTILDGEKTAAKAESERCTGVRLYRKATALVIKGGKLCRQNQQNQK